MVIEMKRLIEGSDLEGDDNILSDYGLCVILVRC